MNQKPIVFIIRNKPWGKDDTGGADIIELVLKYKRVFVGYPPFKKDVPLDEDNMASCTYDISKDSFDKDSIRDQEFIGDIHKNMNLVKDAIPGSFVIVPRPEQGYYYIGDIIQSWVVEDFKQVSPFKFPAWIRHSLFGRSTFGRMKDLDNNNQVYDII